MSDARLPRSARLLTSIEFKRVFDARRAVSNRFFRIHYAPHPKASGHGARLGLAIARRVARRAVDRNRLRRLARESFRRNRRRLPAADFVVLARPQAVTAERGSLSDALDELWLKFETS